MSAWNRFEIWIQTGTGISATIGAAGLLFAGVWKFGRSCIAFAVQGAKTIKMHWNFEDYMTKQFDRMEHRFDHLEERVESVEDGVVNGIKVRRDVMEEDRKFAWMEAKPDGRFEWVNRLWYEITGMTAEETIGYGWINGILEGERAQVLTDWKYCVSKEIMFDRKLTLVNTRNGIQTHVRLAAGPGRGKVGGKIVLYSGHAVKL